MQNIDHDDSILKMISTLSADQKEKLYYFLLGLSSITGVITHEVIIHEQD